MAEETVEQFLARRERELMSTASVLRSQLAPVEAELAKVRRMRAVQAEPIRPTNALAGLLNQSDSNLPFKIQPAPDVLLGAPWNAAAIAELAANPSIAEVVSATYATRTIKDLSIQGLIDAFPHGATTSELKEFMHAGYGRNIDPGSLRTQLHRLKGAGILGHEPSTDTWNFRDGQRALYAMYDHPTSRRDMKELQDTPTQDDADDSAPLRATEKFPWGDGFAEQQAKHVSSSEMLQNLRKKVDGDKT